MCAALFLLVPNASASGSFEGSAQTTTAPSNIDCDVSNTNATSVSSVVVTHSGTPTALVAGVDYTVDGLPDDKFQIKLTAVGKAKVHAGDEVEVTGSTVASGSHSVSITFS